MLDYRCFRNPDPPALIAIWRSRQGQPGLMQPISADVLEQLVFGKPYFDYRGLFVARENGRPVGFAHAAFGPSEAHTGVCTDLGVTCMLVVRPDCDEQEVASGLLQRCEQYLRGRGAKVLYGGAIRPLNPFYLGLYGGSELPGVLESDGVAQRLYRTHGYREIDRTLVFRRGVESFRAPVSRAVMQIRRSTTLEVLADPPSRSWWEACTTGDFDLTRFRLVPRGGGPALGAALVRNLEPTPGYAANAVGLTEVQVPPKHRRRGVATFLVSEVFRHLVGQGAGLVETQTMVHNAAAVGLYRKLGFEEAERGIVFRKDSVG